MQLENEKNQALMRAKKEQERLEDIKLQKQYAAKLEKEEQDRINEMNARERRAQEFMNRMADGVLKEMDELQKKED